MAKLTPERSAGLHPLATAFEHAERRVSAIGWQPAAVLARRDPS